MFSTCLSFIECYILITLLLVKCRVVDPLASLILLLPTASVTTSTPGPTSWLSCNLVRKIHLFNAFLARLTLFCPFGYLLHLLLLPRQVNLRVVVLLLHRPLLFQRQDARVAMLFLILFLLFVSLGSFQAAV